MSGAGSDFTKARTLGNHVIGTSMKKRNYLSILLCLLVSCGWAGCSIDDEGRRVFGFHGFAYKAPPNEADVVISIRNRSDAISQFLSDKNLVPIEGVWIWGNSSHEVAIIPNTTEHYKEYDYLGVITDTRSQDYSRGEIRMLLKETASSQAYSGFYITGRGYKREELGTMFILSSPNLLEFSIPRGRYSGPLNALLVRTYPKAVKTEYTKEAENSSGTGVFVTQDLVVTNYHVIREAKQISFSIGERSIKAELLLKDSQNDLALLKISSGNSSNNMLPVRKRTCFQLGDSEKVRAGDVAYTLGFPLSGLLASTPTIGQGVISNFFGLNNDPRMFQISIPIQPGNSGSPLIDSNGRVIGVVTSTLNSKEMLKVTGSLPQNVNFAMKSSYLKSLLSMIPSYECLGSLQPPKNLTAREIQDQFGSSVVAISVSR